MKPTETALVVIDPQNDFLAEGGAFSKRHMAPSQCADALAWSVSIARQQGRKVCWVLSDYSASAGDRALAGETHTGAPCCVEGTWGAAVIDALVSEHSRAGDLSVVKRWYSAFRETTLDASLRSAGVRRLIVCGVATNVCVLATARAARALGYEVWVLRDATVAGTAGKHTAALRELEGLGCSVRSIAELAMDSADEVVLRGLGSGDSALHCNVFGALGADRGALFDTLAHEIEWNVMMHRGGEVPRRVAIQGAIEGSVEPLYRHPADEQPVMVSFSPTVDAIRRAVEARTGHPLNHCLAQLYRTGRDWISAHSDKTLDLERPSFVVNASFGRTRTMLFEPKVKGAVATQKVPLPDGSVLLMGLGTNRERFHEIKQEGQSDDDGPRISLTFRWIGTFYDRETRAVWGVGSPAKTQPEALAILARRRELDGAALRAELHDESLRMLRVFREENVDPSFDAAKYQPGFTVLDLSALEGGDA
ncbi:MAG: isochorismatase family protein [Myxococcales bacterium]|nr:isochorismatase family protein [Myxococcales bacterium]